MTVEYRVRVVPKTGPLRCAWVRVPSVEEARVAAAAWLVAVRRSMTYPDLRPTRPGRPGEFGQFNAARAKKFRREVWPWTIEIEARSIDDDDDEAVLSEWEKVTI